MNNLKSICGILHVHLRINVDIKNIELANEVVSHLKQENMLEYIHPYLGLVIPYNGSMRLINVLQMNSIQNTTCIL